MLLLPPRTVSATNAGLVNNPPATLLVAMSPREATAAAKRRDDAIMIITILLVSGSAGTQHLILPTTYRCQNIMKPGLTTCSIAAVVVIYTSSRCWAFAPHHATLLRRKVVTSRTHPVSKTTLQLLSLHTVSSLSASSSNAESDSITLRPPPVANIDRVLSKLTSLFPLFVLGSAILGSYAPSTLHWVNENCFARAFGGAGGTCECRGGCPPGPPLYW